MKTINASKAETFRDPKDVDIAIGQMLALAELANVSFTVTDDRLIMRAARMNPKFWPPVRSYLDEIGIDAITDFFRRTTDADRVALAAAA